MLGSATLINPLNLLILMLPIPLKKKSCHSSCLFLPSKKVTSSHISLTSFFEVFSMESNVNKIRPKYYKRYSLGGTPKSTKRYRYTNTKRKSTTKTVTGKYFF